jgi:hypothetical protein
MQFLEIAKLIISLFPLLIQAVQAVEAAIPNSGNGQQKLELIKSIIQTSYESSNKLVASFEQLWSPLSSVVQAIVTAFNAVGIFKKPAA